MGLSSFIPIPLKPQVPGYPFNLNYENYNYEGWGGHSYSKNGGIMNSPEPYCHL